MKKISIFFVLVATTLFSQQISSEKNLLENGLFQSPYKVEGACQPQCRTVKSGYKTKVMDMDVKSGITYCSVYRENDLDNAIGADASTKNENCAAGANFYMQFGELESERAGDKFKENAKIVYKETNKLPLSRFLGAMMTLDPDIIDFQRTKDTGIITLKDPASIFIGYGDEGVLSLSSNGSTTRQTELTATADSYNKANLGYYSNLYANMAKIYKYLQVLLVVFIGMFFIAQIGVRKGIKWLDKSQDEDHNKWLMSFVTPVLGVAFFFVPIPEDAGMSTNVVQKITRYFTQQSIQIADRAAAIGIDTYMTKLYATVGAQSARGEKAIIQEETNSGFQARTYESYVNTYCKYRYPNVVSFQRLTPNEMHTQEIHAMNNFANFNGGVKFDEMSFLACREFETKWQAYQTINKQLAAYKEQIIKAYRNNELQEKLIQINDGLQNRFDELGWIQAVAIPGMSVIIELLPIIEDNTAIGGDDQREEIKDKIEARYKDNREKELLEQIQNAPSALGDSFKELSGWFIGKFAYFILPGSGEVYDRVETGLESTLTKLSLMAAGTSAGGAGGGPGGAAAGFVGGAAAGKLISFGSSIAAVFITAWIYGRILNMLPVLICIISASIAIIGYLIELAKYFYITPFVVAFAITTKRTYKVIEFLITGVAIFFKPILIVIFIFFALFIHSLVQDVFMTMSLEQFTLMREFNENSGTGVKLFITLSIFEVLIQIIGTLGSCYIMWKLILTAPAWTMRLVGIDNQHNDVFAEDLAHKLERHSFQA